MTLICTKVWELSAGNFHVKKTMELRAQNAQLAGGAKMVQRICKVFDELRESYQELKKSCENPGSSDLESSLERPKSWELSLKNANPEAI